MECSKTSSCYPTPCNMVKHAHDIECSANHVARTARYKLCLLCLCPMNSNMSVGSEIVNVTLVEGRNL